MFLNELCKDIRYDDKIEYNKCDYLLLYFVKFNSIPIYKYKLVI